MSHSASLTVVNGHLTRLGPLMILEFRLFIWKLVDDVFGDYTLVECIDHIASIFTAIIGPAQTIFCLLFTH